MFRFCVSLICHFFAPVCSQRLNRVTHPPIFSRLAGAQFTDCNTCLATNYFVSVWTDTAFSPVHSLHFWVWIFMNMFLFHVSIICHFSIPVCYNRLSRALHLYIFSHPAGAQFADCITCLASNHFVSVWADNCLSASSLVFYIYIQIFILNTSEHVSFLSLIHLLFLHRFSRAIHQHIFSRLAGTRFVDFITCFAHT